MQPGNPATTASAPPEPPSGPAAHAVADPPPPPPLCPAAQRVFDGLQGAADTLLRQLHATSALDMKLIAAEAAGLDAEAQAATAALPPLPGRHAASGRATPRRATGLALGRVTRAYMSVTTQQCRILGIALPRPAKPKAPPRPVPKLDYRREILRTTLREASNVNKNAPAGLRRAVDRRLEQELADDPEGRIIMAEIYDRICEEYELPMILANIPDEVLDFGPEDCREFDHEEKPRPPRPTPRPPSAWRTAHLQPRPKPEAREPFPWPAPPENPAATPAPAAPAGAAPAAGSAPAGAAPAGAKTPATQTPTQSPQPTGPAAPKAAAPDATPPAAPHGKTATPGYDPDRPQFPQHFDPVDDDPDLPYWHPARRENQVPSWGYLPPRTDPHPAKPSPQKPSFGAVFLEPAPPNRPAKPRSTGDPAKQ